MAFNKLNWAGNVWGVGYTGSPKMHAYKDSAALATVAGSGYLNTVEAEIDTGDAVLVNSTATTGGGNKLYRATNSSGTVTLAAFA